MDPDVKAWLTDIELSIKEIYDFLPGEKKLKTYYIE